MTAATKRNFEPLDELRYAQIDSAKLSPDGTQVVYSVRQVDLEKEKEFTHLWLLDLATGQTRQLTRGDHNNSAPSWSPDGETIAFLSTRSEKPQIFTISARCGEAIRLTQIKQGAGSGPVWSPDGKQIAFTVSPQLEARDPVKPYRITRAGYRMDGVGYLDDVVQNIFVAPITNENGLIKAGEPRQLTDDALMDTELEWSPDGQEILYASLYKPESLAIFSARISIVNLNGEVSKLLDEEWGDISTAAWLSDGQQIALYGQLAGTVGGSKGDLWVYDRRTKEIVCRSKEFMYGLESNRSKLLVLDQNKALCSVQREGMGEIYEFSLAGKPEWHAVITGQRACAGLDVQQGKLLFSISQIHNPSELCVANVDGSEEKQITRHNDQWLENINIPEVEHFVFQNSKGIPIEGWFLKPASGELPCPAVLNIHGGPYGMFGYSFRSDFQMLAGAGYGVLFINPQGSNGYGDAFSQPLNANWGLLDYPEQMQAVDLAIEKGWIDADRLGVNGLSYGGYMTCWVVGQTTRFKAAVAENPVTNMVSQYGTSDMDAWDAPFSLGGAPHENPELYRLISPITYAHQCTTPTLLILGEKDFRCPAGQSEEFYTTLRANGCIAEMLRLPGGSHIGSIAGAITLRKAQNEALLDWMNRYVPGKKNIG
ncbi:MAG: S9 family peptidase [Chloroflexi bacterium]|nr:S9 family peptidase [Chloroflexota bacterium]